MFRNRTGRLLKQTETFKYLGSVMNAKGGCEHNVKNRIKVDWLKWKDLSGVLCDVKMTKSVKGKGIKDNNCDARAQNRSFVGNYLQRYKQK